MKRGFLLDCWWIQLGHRLDLHVSAEELPFVVGFEKDRADKANDAVLVGEDADDIGTALQALDLRAIMPVARQPARMSLVQYQPDSVR